jgi:hypothetical protein
MARQKKDESAHQTESVLVPVFADTPDWEDRKTAAEKISLGPRLRYPCLMVISGRGEGDLYKVKSGETLTIGRGEEAGICLQDNGISRIHARILCDGEEVTIEDLNSRNGTFVEGKRIRSHRLKAEDLVSIGGTTILKFSLVDEIEEAYRARMRAR